MDSGRKGISSFSILLLMAVTAVVGIACISQLKVQYIPSGDSSTISVQYYYPGASSRIVEGEVTSVLEGALCNVQSCKSITSDSYDGGGQITLTLEKKADMEAVRFEVASVIRNVRESLPEGCTYPFISRNVRGEVSPPAIVFDVRSPRQSKDIADFVKDFIVYPITTVKGVGDVEFYGHTPYEQVITFDADKCSIYGIDADQIASSINDHYREDVLGMVRSGVDTYSVRLAENRSGDMMDLPVKNVSGRIIRLGDVAEMRYQEAMPDSYFRINGLNTLVLAVGVPSDENIIETVSAVKRKMNELSLSFPADISVSVSQDRSEFVKSELEKIYFRTALCLLILLLFVFVFNRSWKYMAVIAITLAVNIFVSVAVYFFCGLHIHIYTLAGITVSLGIIIDNSIMMIDHYTRHHDRSVFPALLSAVLTTVAALLVVLLLPDREKANLTDFAFVIIINLSVSLLVSYLFVPALLDYVRIDKKSTSTRVRSLRRTVRRSARYSRFISWGRRHKWVFVLAFVLSFGLPLCLLKESYGNENEAPLTRWQKIMNKIVQWPPYADNKQDIDRIAGTSFALFQESLSNADFYREPERQELVIRAGMPEGCSVGQLNEVVKCMENYLANFEEIESFETNINSYRDGTLRVHFKEAYENTPVPLGIKADIIKMASDFGGANWSVFGLDDSWFNNNIITDQRSQRVCVRGYNYDDLYSYACILKDYLSLQKRVRDVEIWGSGYRSRPLTEFNVNYDFAALSAYGVSPYQYYASLYSPLYNQNVMRLPFDGGYVNVRLESSRKDAFDAWHVDNMAVPAGDTKMKLSQVGSIRKERSGLPISRTDQSYELNVVYNFIGSPQLSNKVWKDAVRYMNSSVLPVGYKASVSDYSWFMDNQSQTAGLILLVIIIIFFICAIHFNSLRYPLSIIWLIPISFIGVFLIFGATGFVFDKGGFAAFIMLSGITVNAGIYLISAYRRIGGADPVRRYLKAFNYKLRPVSLTILSTVLGLIPFLFDGPGEVFWFPFAVGTIAGLIFSIIALLVYLPVFAVSSSERNG